MQITKFTVRLSEEQRTRIEALVGLQRMAAFIREAIDEKLKREEIDERLKTEHD